MKRPAALLLVLALSCLGLLAPSLSATESSAESPPAQEKPAGHPLTGIVRALMPERSALVVQHEEVPGVMRAMSMMFRVDPGILETMKLGTPITAVMYRDTDGKWCLRDIVVTAPSSS